MKTKSGKMAILRLIVFYYLFICSLPCFGQLKSTLDLVGGLEYSNYVYSDRNEPLTIQSISAQKERELGKMNTRFGLNYILELNQKLYVKSGLRFMKGGFKTKKVTNIMWPQEFDSNGVWTPRPDFHHEHESFVDFLFFEVPLIIGFKIEKEKRITPFLETGFSPMFYITTKSHKITDLENTVSYSRADLRFFNELQIAYSISVGMNIKISNKTEIFLQSIGRYNITSLAKIKEFSGIPIPQQHLYNFGLETGVRQRIIKY